MGTILDTYRQRGACGNNNLPSSRLEEQLLASEIQPSQRYFEGEVIFLGGVGQVEGRLSRISRSPPGFDKAGILYQSLDQNNHEYPYSKWPITTTWNIHNQEPSQANGWPTELNMKFHILPLGHSFWCQQPLGHHGVPHTAFPCDTSEQSQVMASEW